MYAFGNDTLRQTFYFDDNLALIPSTEENPNPKPYTAEQNARADRAVIDGVASVNRQALRGDIAAQIDIIKAMIGTTADAAGTNTMRAIKNSTNSTINAGPAPYIKAVNQNQIDLAQALVRLSRLVADVVDDISTAPL